MEQLREAIQAPEILEPIGRQLGVAGRVLNVLLPEVTLQGPRIDAPVPQ